MHYSLYFNRLILSALLFLTPFHPDETAFPQTRTLSLYWTLKVETIDLGYNQSVTYNSSSINEQTVKHNYQIVYTLDINCNSACALANTDTGYNIDSNHIVKYFFGRNTYTPSEMSQALNNLTKYGTEQKSYTFATSESSAADVNFTLTLLTGNWITHVYFPATTEGILLDEIDTNLQAFHLTFTEWKNLDIEHKTMEIKFWINQMNNSGRPLPSSVYDDVTSYLNNDDPDSAFTIVNNYYYASIPYENETTTEKVTNYTNTNVQFTDLTTTEHEFSDDIENDFSDQEVGIATNKDTVNTDFFSNSKFLNSANWVKTQFERITNNNAFGTLLGFSLIVGFAMAVIGRIIK